VSEGLYTFVSLDLPALLALVFASVACGLMGNFLVLRRLSLMGDAIAHAVLPGIVLAFLVMMALGRPDQARHPLVMTLGAAASGVVTVLLVETIRRLGRVETGAAMGVAFSIMFALGVLMLEQAAAHQTDLDAECVLYGQLETIFWFPPRQTADLLTFGALSQAPRQVWTLALAAGGVILLVTLFYKELRIAAFDPALATTLGFSARLLHYAQMTVVAVAAVAAFEAVGSILVIALIICPAACARLLTDRLLSQLLVSVAVAVGASVAGYTLGAHAPLWLGAEHSLNAAGSVAVTLGAALTLAIIAAPRHGVVARRLRLFRLAVEVAREDALGLLHRAEEQGLGGLPRVALLATLDAGLAGRLGLRGAVRRGLVSIRNGECRLTDAGRDAARSLVRRHRLWETYLVEHGARPDHVHGPAERLEHARGAGDRAIEPTIDADHDPHGRPIPR